MRWRRRTDWEWTAHWPSELTRASLELMDVSEGPGWCLRPNEPMIQWLVRYHRPSLSERLRCAYRRESPCLLKRPISIRTLSSYLPR